MSEDAATRRRDALQRMGDAANELTGLLLQQLAESRLDQSQHVMKRLAAGAHLEISLNLSTFAAELTMFCPSMGVVPLARSVVPQEEMGTLQ